MQVFLILLAFGITTIELTRRVGEPSGLIKDLHAVWYLPTAILLPPLYCLLAPIPILALSQARIRRAPVYRRVYTASAIGISLGAASLLFHIVMSSASVPAGPGPSQFLWAMMVAGCGALRTSINKLLVVSAIKGSEPSANLRELALGREVLYNDLAELSLGVVVTFTVARLPIMVIFALPFVTLLQRSQRHAQLVDASRIDAKTGLLNAITWQREARHEITRAIRTRAPLAVAIADLDHFKAVNDTYGHLTGDAVLAGIARGMLGLLRDYDITGRFGGEEFVILLPQTGAAEAARIAERLRAKLAEIIIPVNAGTAAESPLQVTVSIGVATLDGSRRDLDDMLAAADAALYEAKNSGRNRVCVLADSAPRF
jgi:diguanylate cyclase (GGDEF)-like protein